MVVVGIWKWQKERRLKTRWQIPKSMDAKVIVRTQQGAGDGRKEAPEQCWQGCLRNICERGTQILVEAVCWEQLRTNQNVMLQFDISSSETEIKTEVIDQVRYILPDERDNSIMLGIEFPESESHRFKICHYFLERLSSLACTFKSVSAIIANESS